MEVDPEFARTIAQLEGEIIDALDGPVGLLHSDLHNQHLLQTDGRLTGLLDFGDAFVGSIAWDFGLIVWYYGLDNARLFATSYEASPETLEQGLRLAIAIGCYKIAKTPHKSAVLERLQALRLTTRSA